MLYFIPKVLIVQSMVNKETFVVKVSIQSSSTGTTQGKIWIPVQNQTGWALHFTITDIN